MGRGGGGAHPLHPPPRSAAVYRNTEQITSNFLLATDNSSWYPRRYVYVFYAEFTPLYPRMGIRFLIVCSQPLLLQLVLKTVLKRMTILF